MWFMLVVADSRATSPALRWFESQQSSHAAGDSGFLHCPVVHLLCVVQGVTDTVVWHPGAAGLPGLEVEPRFFAQVGAGRLALPKK